MLEVSSDDRLLENRWENCLAEDFYDLLDLHACFTMGLNLGQKVHAIGTSQGKICIEGMYIQGSRSRNSDLKRGIVSRFQPYRTSARCPTLH